MKILMSILLCLCLLLQIGCMGNPDTKESHQSGAETTLTEKNMTDTEKMFSVPSDKRTEDYITGRFG